MFAHIPPEQEKSRTLTCHNASTQSCYPTTDAMSQMKYVVATLQALAALEECRSQEGVGRVLVVRLTQPLEIVSGNPSDVVRL